MREIKFRGKRIDNGEWVHGGIITSASRAWIKNNENLFINPLRINQSTADFRLDEVNPETVGQYTGLKDKNGAEIYEGDIVQNIYGDIFTVEYYGEHWYGYVLTASDGCVGHLYEYDEYEVIGTTHDNPELLGGVE